MNTPTAPCSPKRKDIKRWTASLAAVVVAHGVIIAMALGQWNEQPPTPASTGQALLIDMTAPLPSPTQSAPAHPAQPKEEIRDNLPAPVQDAEVVLPKSVKKAETRRPKTEKRAQTQDHDKKTEESNPLSVPGETGLGQGQVTADTTQQISRWHTLVLAHLERYKRYPRVARIRHQEGTVVVHFSIERTGTVLSTRLEKSSGFPLLDQEGLELVRRASPIPAPPPGTGRDILELVAPIQFHLR